MVGGADGLLGIVGRVLGRRREDGSYLARTGREGVGALSDGTRCVFCITNEGAAYANFRPG